MFKWVQGRQQGTYERCTLFTSEWLGIDLHLIRVRRSGFVSWHTDPVMSGAEHHRINWVLWECQEGGVTYIAAPPPLISVASVRSRVYKFRPDIQEHCVAPVTKGTLLMLSFGWLERK